MDRAATPPQGPPLRGRAVECHAIETTLRHARNGRGGGLVLRGEAGIGKTAVLDHTVRIANGMRVLRTAGLEPETALGYAALHRLLSPVLQFVDRLPGPQARALSVAFGMSVGPAPDRFLVALAVLSLLSEIAEERPVVCLIDDAQWIDRSSSDVLGFVSRRLDAESIAMVLTVRSGEGTSVVNLGFRELVVARLDADAARQLLLDSSDRRLSPPEEDEILRASDGNPLAIREFAVAWCGSFSGTPLPLAAGLRRVFLDRVQRFDEAAREVLLLLAADGSGRLAVVRRAARILGVDTSSLDRGELNELLAIEGSSARFRHPLIRSAVYYGVSVGQRSAAHRALASVLPGELDRQAWHVGEAATGPDEAAAAALEHSAARANERAGPAAAAMALARAAQLSSEQAERDRRRAAAAKLWLHAGDTASASRLLERVGHHSEPQPLEATEIRGLLELRAGAPANAVRLLGLVLPQIPTDEPLRVLRLLFMLDEACFLAGTPDVFSDCLNGLPEISASPGNDDSTGHAAVVKMLRASLQARAGRVPRGTLDDLRILETPTEPDVLARASEIAWDLGHFDIARRIGKAAAHQARVQGAAGSLAWILLVVSRHEMVAGRFNAAEAYAEEGFHLAGETGQLNTAIRHQSLLAIIAAIRGREERARELAEGIRLSAAARGLPPMAACVHHVLGLLDLVAQRYEEAFQHFRRMDRLGATPSGAVLGVPDLVEAAAAAGDTTLPEQVLARYRTWAETTGAPELQALATRCRALLAPPDSAEPIYLEALGYYERANRPFDQARTHLLLGEHLRRHRRRADARPHLRAALESFTLLGASAWEKRARAELRTCGGTVGRPDPGALSALTPQEMRIALAVAEGSTNREIAAQLFLSRRTVDYHLRKIYLKAGVASRGDLVRLVLAEH